MNLVPTRRLLAITYCLLSGTSALGDALPVFAINPTDLAAAAPSSPFEKSYYESRLGLLERQARMACRGASVGEGKAYLNFRTMEQAWRMTDEVRRRADSIYEYLDDPQRASREARASELDGRIASLRTLIKEEALVQAPTERVRALVAELRTLEASRTKPNTELSPDSPTSVRLRQRAQRDLEGLATVLTRLDAVAAQANGCYSSACNLHEGSFLAICGESVRMRQLESGGGGRRPASSGDGPVLAR